MGSVKINYWLLIKKKIFLKVTLVVPPTFRIKEGEGYLEIESEKE